MSVLKHNRKSTNFDTYIHALELRRNLMDLILRDFGYKPKPVSEYYPNGRKKTLEVYESDVEKRKKEEEFFYWFCADERDYVIRLLRQLEETIQMGNAIFPTNELEYWARRLEQDKCIGICNQIYNELQFIIETLPVDINNYIQYSDAIDEQIRMIKGWRTKDHKRYKHLVKDDKAPQTKQLKDQVIDFEKVEQE